MHLHMLAGGAASWRSVKKTLVATSTMEAVYFFFLGDIRGYLVKSFTSGFELRILRIYSDNSVVAFMSKNNMNGNQSIHIDIKYLALKERVIANEVLIEHIRIELIIGDPLMKGMPPQLLKDIKVQIALVSIQSVLISFYVN